MSINSIDIDNLFDFNKNLYEIKLENNIPVVGHATPQPLNNQNQSPIDIKNHFMHVAVNQLANSIAHMNHYKPIEIFDRVFIEKNTDNLRNTYYFINKIILESKKNNFTGEKNESREEHDGYVKFDKIANSSNILYQRAKVLAQCIHQSLRRFHIGRELFRQQDKINVLVEEVKKGSKIFTKYSIYSLKKEIQSFNQCLSCITTDTSKINEIDKQFLLQLEELTAFAEKMDHTFDLSIYLPTPIQNIIADFLDHKKSIELNSSDLELFIESLPEQLRIQLFSNNNALVTRILCQADGRIDRILKIIDVALNHKKVSNSITSLELSEIVFFPEDLRKIFIVFSHLQTVNLENCNLDDNHLEIISSTLKKIKKLQISDNYLITDRGIQALCNGNIGENLVSLRLKNCKQLTENSLQLLLFFRKLVQFEFDTTNMKSDAWQLLKNFEALEQLLISGCGKITDKVVENSIAHMLNLEAISLMNCAHFTNNSIISISKLVNLKRVILKGIPSISTLQPFLQLDNLQEVLIEGCDQISPTEVEKLYARPNITSLIIQGKKINRSLMQFSEKMEEMSFINFHDYPNLLITELAKLPRFSKLVDVVLSDRIMASNYLELPPQIKIIDLTGCQQIENKKIELLEKLIKLEVVILPKMISDTNFFQICQLTQLKEFNLPVIVSSLDKPSTLEEQENILLAMQNLTQLRVLTMNYEVNMKTIDVILSKLPFLEKLTFVFKNSSNITTIKPELPSLKILTIRCLSFNGKCSFSFEHSLFLEELNLFFEDRDQENSSSIIPSLIIDQICTLTHLKTLTLSGVIDQEDFYRLCSANLQIRTLDLSRCKISNPIIVEGCEHTVQQTDNIRAINNEDLPWIAKIELLEDLNLNNSNITRVPFNKNLQSLALSGCPFSEEGEGLRGLDQLVQLKVLHLDGLINNEYNTPTIITANLLEPLKHLVNLTYLSLEKNQGLLSNSLIALKKCIQLRILNLQECPIDCRGMIYLEELHYLRDLSLADTQISTAGIKSLIKLPNLANLILSSCPIDDKSCRELAKLQSLQLLIINNCIHITDKGVSKLQRLPLLHVLKCMQCPEISNDALIELHNNCATYLFIYNDNVELMPKKDGKPVIVPDFMIAGMAAYFLPPHQEDEEVADVDGQATVEVVHHHIEDVD